MKTNRAKKILALILCLVLSLSVLAGCGKKAEAPAVAETQGTEAAESTAKKETIRLRIGGGQPESAPMIQYVDTYFCEEVAKQVAENTNYEIEWMKGWGGSMVKLGEALEGAEAGIVDLAVVVIPLEPAKLKVWNMFYYMPFACYDSTKGISTLLEMLDKYPEFTEVFGNYNTKYIGVGYSEPYGMFTSEEITTVKDLNGLKVGAAGANLTWVENSGAATVQSALPEMYTSIQTGVYQVGIQPAAMAINVQAYEVAPYLVDGFSSLPCDLVVMNQNAFDKLPAEVQEIIVSVGKTYTETEPAFVMNAYAEAQKKALENGGSIYTLSQEEKAEWIAVIPDALGDFAKELEDLGMPGTEMIDFYYSGLEAAGAEPVRK